MLPVHLSQLVLQRVSRTREQSPLLRLEPLSQEPKVFRVVALASWLSRSLPHFARQQGTVQ